MIVLDTHVLVWLAEGGPQLGRAAGRRIDEALRRQRVWIPSIAFWEIEMLAQKKRIQLQLPTSEFRLESLRAGIQEAALSGDLALQAASLEGFHGDPADRIIVATALSLEAVLATADEKILSYRRVKSLDARR